jgi:hypothetical protein
MGAGLQITIEPYRLILEVDALDVGTGREAAAIRDYEVEPIGERPLRSPGQLAVDDASVDEKEACPAHRRHRARGARTRAKIASSGVIRVLQAVASALVLSPC